MHAAILSLPEDAGRAPAGGLCGIECRISLGERSAELGARPSAQGRNSDGRAGVDADAVPEDRPAQDPQRTPEIDVEGDRASPAGEEDREFVATDPRDQGRRVKGARQPLRHPAQALVAYRMAEPIVDVLEMIEVHKRQSRNGVVAGFRQLVEAGFEDRSVREARQRVAFGELPQSIEELLLTGDVLLRPEEAHRAPSPAFDAAGKPHPARGVAFRFDAGIEGEAMLALDGIGAQLLHLEPRRQMIHIDDCRAMERCAAWQLEEVVDSARPGQLLAIEEALPGPDSGELRCLVVKLLEAKSGSVAVAQGAVRHCKHVSGPSLASPANDSGRKRLSFAWKLRSNRPLPSRANQGRNSLHPAFPIRGRLSTGT